MKTLTQFDFTKELRRLKNKVSKKDNDRFAEDNIKKLKNERLAASKAITDTWTSTTVNQRRKEIEKKHKLLADIEAAKIKNDERIKLNVLKRRNEIIKKLRLKKWSEKDSTKAITRAMHIMEVLRERDMQMKFNEVEKKRIMEAERLLKIEQNLEAEQFKKSQWEEKIKCAKTKKANAELILKELKEREDMRHSLNLQLHQEGVAELQRIAKEIEEDIKEKKAKNASNNENILKNLNENRKVVAEKNKFNQLEEQHENIVISIKNEAKKKMAKIRKFKEIQLLKEKQLVSEKLAVKANTVQAEKIIASDREYQYAIKEKEQQYKKEEHKRKELEEKQKKYLNDYKQMYDEESRKEKERLTLSTEWESKRNEQETKMLTDLKKASCRKKIDEMNRFRKDLDEQCNNNRKAHIANKREELKQYDTRKKAWHQEDEEFSTCVNKLINKYRKEGRSVVPLQKTAEDYAKNKLL